MCLHVRCPTQTCVCTLSPQQVALFSEVVELLVDGAYLEEVGHRGTGFKFYIPTNFPFALSLYPSRCEQVATNSYPGAFPP